jgi:hydroxymethylpyrimidine pyrophosphatase-like HAD family hydrolase
MKQNAIVCDLDGTILDHKDESKSLQNVVNFLIQQAQTNKIIIMTARSKDSRKSLAIKQLRELGIPFDKLVTNDKDEDSDVYKKREIQTLMNRYNIVLFIDDLKKNRKAIKELGIETKKPKNISNKILTKTVWSGIFI